MDIMEVMRSRHSVRKFDNRPIEKETAELIREEIAKCNEESGFHFQLITDEPEAFQAGKPSYGEFKGCRNYLAVIGPKGREVDAGYYGERIVLKAQELGVNSCWVAMTYKKGKSQGVVGDGEKLYLVVAMGYGITSGTPHKSKSISDVSDYKEGDPEWYKNGIEAALLAPTAINQQKFRFERDNDKIICRTSGFGFYMKTDLGIVKYHFEKGSGREVDDK